MSLTLAVLPDTQIMAKRHPDRFTGIGDWIADNAAPQGLAAVLHVGDVVNDGDRDLDQFAVAAKVRDTIVSAGLPLFVAAGNHDDDNLLKEDRRSLVAFAEHAAVGVDHEWIAGSYEGQAADDGASNVYGFVTLGGYRLLVVVMEFGPRKEVVTWADRVLREHADTDAIVLTHAYLNCDGTRMAPGAPFHPAGSNAARDGYDGEALWPVLRRHPRLRAIFCGHQIPGNIAYRVDAAEDGHGVLASFQNWQSEEEGGGGRIRLVEWDPSALTMTLSVINTATGEVEHQPGYDLRVDLSAGSADLGVVWPGASAS